MKAEIKNKKLIIEIDLDETPKTSASGKSIVIASTRGNQTTELTVQGKSLVVALNAYIKA
jgi:N-acetylmuramoyl-L-alanine amidase